MKNANISLCVLVVSFLATACGNIATNTLNDPALSSANAASTSGTLANSFSPSQQCNSNTNIHGPSYNNSISVEYTACNTNGALQVFPTDRNTKSICVFPAHIDGSNVSVYVGNANAANYQDRYVYQCNTTSTAGAIFNFGQADMNGAYIVAQKDASTFATCLAYGDISMCASNVGLNYGYGQF